MDPIYAVLAATVIKARQQEMHRIAGHGRPRRDAAPARKRRQH